MGTQKNQLDETALFEHPKHVFTQMDKKNITFYNQKVRLTGPIKDLRTYHLLDRQHAHQQSLARPSLLTYIKVWKKITDHTKNYRSSPTGKLIKFYASFKQANGI